jgi:DNA-binding NtrC family response regulator
MAEAILRREGFQIIQTIAGRDGYNVVRHIGDSIDLVLTDINMTKIGELSLAESVKALYPRMPVLLMTGEPFPPRKLADAVRKAMISVSADS